MRYTPLEYDFSGIEHLYTISSKSGVYFYVTWPTNIYHISAIKLYFSLVSLVVIVAYPISEEPPLNSASVEKLLFC